MTIQLTLWQVLTISGSFLMLLFAFGRILLANFKEHVDTRFNAVEAARNAAVERWQQLHDRLAEELRQESGEIARLEREFIELKMTVGQDYVKRHEIDALIDRVVARIDKLSDELKDLDRHAGGRRTDSSSR